VKIVDLSAGFIKCFSETEEEPEGNRGILRYGVSIAGTIGDISFINATVLLQDIWSLMEAQPAGQPGPLSTDGSDNIFIVQNYCDNQIVLLSWSVIGWYLRIYEKDEPNKLTSSSRFFSH